MRACGIDGWRLDVADEVSHDFWRRFRKEVKRENPQAILIAESWHDAGSWLRGDQFDGIMNYSFTKACIDFFAKKTRTVQSFCDRLNELLMRNTDQANEMMLNLLDSHDTERFLTLAGEDRAALRCALAVMFFYPGMPCICYGTEIGMIGEYEPDSRRTFDWGPFALGCFALGDGASARAVQARKNRRCDPPSDIRGIAGGGAGKVLARRKFYGRGVDVPGARLLSCDRSAFLHRDR